MRSIWIVAGALLMSLLLLLLTAAPAVSADEEVNTCVCPRNLVPVCGTDNKTYSNRCLLHCQMDSANGRSIGLRMAHKGRC